MTQRYTQNMKEKKKKRNKNPTDQPPDVTNNYCSRQRRGIFGISQHFPFSVNADPGATTVFSNRKPLMIDVSIPGEISNTMNRAVCRSIILLSHANTRVLAMGSFFPRWFYPVTDTRCAERILAANYCGIFTEKLPQTQVQRFSKPGPDYCTQPTGILYWHDYGGASGT